MREPGAHRAQSGDFIAGMFTTELTEADLAFFRFADCKLPVSPKGCDGSPVIPMPFTCVISLALGPEAPRNRVIEKAHQALLFLK